MDWTISCSLTANEYAKGQSSRTLRTFCEPSSIALGNSFARLTLHKKLERDSQAHWQQLPAVFRGARLSRWYVQHWKGLPRRSTSHYRRQTPKPNAMP